MYPGLCDTCRVLSEALQDATARLVEARSRMANIAGTRRATLSTQRKAMCSIYEASAKRGGLNWNATEQSTQHLHAKTPLPKISNGMNASNVPGEKPLNVTMNAPKRVWILPQPHRREMREENRTHNQHRNTQPLNHFHPGDPIAHLLKPILLLPGTPSFLVDSLRATFFELFCNI
jgi:hypothetical protein